MDSSGEFSSGCRVQLVSMNDPYTRINPGTHSTLEVVYGEDSCRKIGGNTTDVRAVYQRQRR